MPLLSTFSALSIRAFESGSLNLYRFYQKLFPSSGTTNENFGRDVSMSKDGLYLAVTNTRSECYIYYKSSGSWSLQQTVATKSSTPINVGFVSLNESGDVLVTSYGLVYTRSGTTWTLSQTLSLTYDTAGNDVVVDSTGDYIAVWEYGVSSVISIWYRSGGTWSLQQSLSGFTNLKAGQGQTLSFNDNATYLAFGEFQVGVHIYLRTGTSWALQQTVTPTAGNSGDRFGHAIDFDANADILVAGQPSYNSGSGLLGYVIVFSRSGTTWTQIQVLVPSNAQSGDFFGGSVYINDSKKTILAGALGNDEVYYFTDINNLSVWNEIQILESGETAGDNFGYALSADANADTFATSGPGDDEGGTGVGAVWNYQKI